MRIISFLVLLLLPVLVCSQDLKLILIGDSQQREIYGYPTGFSSRQAQEQSKVAIRSSEQELFSKYVHRAVFELEPDANAVIHLGDLLDYSCASEWDVAFDVLPEQYHNKIFLAPGNHDGIFQGNNNYGSLIKFFLRIMKLFKSDYDPGLQGHFGAVCNRGQIPGLKGYENTQFRKKDVFCAYLKTIRNPNLAAYNDLLEFCGVVEDARSQPIKDDEKSHASIDFPDVSLGLTLPLIYNDDFNWAVAAHFPHQQTASWSNGFFVQSFNFGLLDDTKLHFVLLDTTDWQTEPSYDLSDISLDCNADYSRSVRSAKCGNLSEEQIKLVESYLCSVNSNDVVFIAGHYPVKDLSARTYEWLLKTIQENPTKRIMYVSAHTHSGYIVKNQPIRELNLDSLIDNPVTYWTVSYATEQGEICFSQQSLYQKLGCDQLLGEGAVDLYNSIKTYKEKAEPWIFDGGESQWRNRAKDTYRAILDFILLRKLDISCEPKDGNFFDLSAMSTIIQMVSTCQDQLDNEIKNNQDLQVYAACQSIVGSRVFSSEVEPKTYERSFCFPIKAESLSSY